MSEFIDTPPNTIESLMTVTDSVVLGEVLAVEAGIFNTPDRRSPDPGRPRGPGYEPGVLTPIIVQVKSAIAGDEQSGTVRVVVEGGEAGCVVHWVDNAPHLERGQTYVFFLQPSKDAEGARHPELPGVVAAWPIDAAGRVQTEEDGLLTLAEFVAKVRVSQ